MSSSIERYKEVEQIIDRLDKLFDEQNERTKISEVLNLKRKLEDITQSTYGFLPRAKATKINHKINIARSLVQELLSYTIYDEMDSIIESIKEDLDPNGLNED